MLSDPAAEKAVLSCLFNYGRDVYIDVSDIIQQSSTFSIFENELFYLCLKHAFEELEIQTPDIATIYSSAKDIGFEHKIKNYKCEEHISQVIAFDANLENVRKYAAKIRKLSIGKTILKNLEEAKEEVEQITGEEKISSILGVAENKIFDLANHLNDLDNEPDKLQDFIEDYIEQRKNNVVDQVGISTGLPVFDKTIGGGLRPGTVSIIGARPKNFKSGLALNVSMHVSDLGIPVLYLDTELQKQEQIPRMLAKLSGIKIEEIETGKFSRDEQKVRRINEIKSKISEKFYHEVIAGLPFEDQLSIIRRWLFKEVGINLNGKANPCLIVYDYLKLMDSEGLSKLQEYQLLGFILTGLHNFCIKYNIPVFTFVQLNRDGISREDTSTIAQSDRLLWFCSNFSVLKRKSIDEIQSEEEQEIHNAGNFKLVPLACRHGSGLESGDYINLKINGECFQIEEGQTLSELKMNKKIFEKEDDDAEIEF